MSPEDDHLGWDETPNGHDQGINAQPGSAGLCWCGAVCRVCRVPGDGPNGDLAHFPRELSDEDYKELAALWDLDPYADLVVCEACWSARKMWDGRSEVAS